MQIEFPKNRAILLGNGGLKKMKILLSRDVIAARVRELGAELSGVYRGRRPVCVALMNGALPFAADLIRTMDIPLELDTLSVSSYAGQHSTGEIKFRST